ncbi:Inositol-pentakisphosphate 2-kinase [Lecanora helva]
MSTKNTLKLGLSDLRLQYLAEGAANVVYRILPPDPDSGQKTAADLYFENYDLDSDTPLPTEIPPLQIDPVLNGKLVRLRKDLPTTAPTSDSQSHFEAMIKPLFQTENLVEAVLFEPSSDLLISCNKELRRMEADGTRPAKRHGDYLVEDEKHGCLISDMSCPDPERFKCFEFKPKWLVQSPSAPAGSRRCRTCALRAMKKSKKSENPETSKAAFCPLNLVSIDKAKLSIFVEHMLELNPKRDRSKDADVTAAERERLMEFLYKNPLLDRLRDLQLELDPDGVFKADLMSPTFLAAMTLRDCTLYLKVPTSGKGGIEARLGDLDLKTSSGKKAEYWRSLESQLIDGGWYKATEEGNTSQENLCQLS